MKLDEVIEVCKELNLECKAHNCGTDWYVYTPNSSRWISCYYICFAQAVIYNSGLPMIDNKDDFREGLMLKLKKIKEESIKDRIKALNKDFQ